MAANLILRGQTNLGVFPEMFSSNFLPLNCVPFAKGPSKNAAQITTCGFRGKTTSFKWRDFCVSNKKKSINIFTFLR